MLNKIRVALPAGDLREPVAELLAARGLRIDGYGEGSRSYRLNSAQRDDITARVFREKDIPIQVALGNYDLGVCKLAWVKQMETRYARQPVVTLCDLAVSTSYVVAAGADGRCESIDDLAKFEVVRVASEYPNIAEAFARSARLTKYRIQPLWGAAEAYPPDDADCVVIDIADKEAPLGASIKPLFTLLENVTCLIGNVNAVASKDLSAACGPLINSASATDGVGPLRLPPPIARAPANGDRTARDVVRMAVPDGHQQRHVVEALRDAGLAFAGYGDGETVRRPKSGIDGLEVKVIRPQDMASLVATGEMDIAITGRDCLLEHRYAFPSSPVEELVDLRRAQYNLSAVVSEDLPASTIEEAMAQWRGEGKAIVRVASEFPVTADHYARSKHFWRYQVIPISGASEGFVPEDADLLIEGTETGKTLRENRLKAIDLLYRSTTCVIANRNVVRDGRRNQLFGRVISMLGRAGATTTV